MYLKNIPQGTVLGPLVDCPPLILPLYMMEESPKEQSSGNASTKYARDLHMHYIFVESMNK